MAGSVEDLGRAMKAKHPGAYDDVSDAELGRAVQKKNPGAYDDFADSVAATGSPEPRRPLMVGSGSPIGGLVTEHLPMIGGVLGGIGGGIAGAPAGPWAAYGGAVGGAGLGGAAGEAIKEVAQGDPLSGEKIVREGAWQGGSEAAGGAIARGANALARPIMRRALGVGKSIMKDFPDAVETTLKDKILATKSVLGGAGKATRLREESADALWSLLRGAKGTKLKTADVTAEVRRLFAKPEIPTKVKAEIASQLSDFLKQHGKTVEPSTLKAIKTLYQQTSKAAMSAEKTSGPSLALSSQKLFARKLAKGAKTTLEQIPGVAEREARTQSLIGAERAVKDAVMKPPPALDLHRPGSWPVVGTLTSPAVKSGVAVILADPTFQAAMRQSPRAAIEYMRRIALSAESDATAVGQ